MARSLLPGAKLNGRQQKRLADFQLMEGAIGAARSGYEKVRGVERG